MTQAAQFDFRPSGGNSVMASRAVVQPTEHDFFPTPPAAARAGGELIAWLDPAARTVWEPACGEGHMAAALAERFGVYASDIADYGGAFPMALGTVDFLSPAAEAAAERFEADWIVSNPPFVTAEAFVRAAWPRARRGVAMLLRLQWKEGGGRYAMFSRDCPLALSAPFAERVAMFAGYWDPGGSTTTAYCWFLFLKPQALAQSPLAGAIIAAQGAGCSLERLIPPGTIDRLSRPSDVATFGPYSVRACERLASDCECDGEAGAKRAKALRAAALRIQGLIDAQTSPLFAGMTG